MCLLVTVRIPPLPFVEPFHGHFEEYHTRKVLETSRVEKNVGGKFTLLARDGVFLVFLEIRAECWMETGLQGALNMHLHQANTTVCLGLAVS